MPETDGDDQDADKEVIAQVLLSLLPPVSMVRNKEDGGIRHAALLLRVNKSGTQKMFWCRNNPGDDIEQIHDTSSAKGRRSQPRSADRPAAAAAADSGPPLPSSNTVRHRETAAHPPAAL